MIDADALQNLVAGRIAILTQQLEARVKANLSGAVLNERSGRLLASITSGTVDDGDSSQGYVASAGVPYAAIQEYGGKTPRMTSSRLKQKPWPLLGAAAKSSRNQCIIRAPRSRPMPISARHSPACGT